MTDQPTPVRLARSLGTALAVAASAPVALPEGPLAAVLVPAGAALAAWWASPAVVRRPVAVTFARRAQLARHRNTALAVVCVLLSALSTPPIWAAACVTSLLLGYLLCVDAAAGPAGLRQLRSRWAPAAAYTASALVLLASYAPVAPSGWGRIIAALAVSCSAVAVGLALWSRRSDQG
ncbi:hypothetical protein ACFC1R_28100 [Kitasatospora sp. NPDC056138]|uniref:hypothetical protein n=1 Tax=Kitasatospora sp. NPDC056138 TaxID=3345724 RepID=UPI0035D54B2C